MTAIRIRGLVKRFGPTTAVDAVDLDIAAGQLFFLLGPSGCGKTTLLRMIAGFIEPTDGAILFDDKDVTHMPANRRRTGMVFQSYALWPHMTVADNVAYGLKVQKVPAAQRRARIMAALRLVHMEAYAARKPNQLSGGQQQRVALARALVIEPAVLLLDEPLSNLDAKLRLEMRSEIRRICTETRITTVYVTHDQKEALSMADNIAVMRDGKVVQVGPPRELYLRPSSSFVADFLGETNFLPGKVIESSNGAIVVKTAAGILRSTTAPSNQVAIGSDVICSVRPEALRIGTASANHNSFSARRLTSTFLGDLAQHTFELAPGIVLKALELHPSSHGIVNDPATLSVSADDVVIVV